MTKKEFIGAVQGEKGIYSQYDLEEFLGSKFGMNFIADEIESEKHRWFESTVSVWKCVDGLIGVRLPSLCYSESMDWCDCGEEPTFYSINEVVKTSYEVGKNLVRSGL